MTTFDPMLHEVSLAIENGRHDDALRGLIVLFGKTDEESYNKLHRMAMFMWEQLLADHPPARQAYRNERDEQVRRLLSGDHHFTQGTDFPPRPRFQVIAQMNKTLGEQRATYELFKQFEACMPDLARKQAFLALAAIIEAEDYAMAERYLPDPLHQLDKLNTLAGQMPLLAPAGSAPRLGAELSNFMKDVRMRNTLLRGLGRDSEADALQQGALAGIDADDMRALAQQEMAAPGTILQKLIAAQELPGPQSNARNAT